MTKIRTNSLLQALREKGLKVRQGRGGQYYAQCPAHDDKNPSLSVKDDNGYAVIHCHAGCSYQDIMGALGLNGEAVHPAPNTVQRQGPSRGYAGPPLRWLAEYCQLEPGWIEGDRHLTGEGQYVVFRFLYGGKEIARKLRRAGTKDIHWEPAGEPAPPLWPIPEAPGTHIVLCEGETDTIILRSRGIEAYAVTKGAQAGIDDVLAKTLCRKGVQTASLVFDADDAGRKGAEKVRRVLEAAGIAVDVVDLADYLDGATGGKDVRDIWRRDEKAFARLWGRLTNPTPSGAGGEGIRGITAKELFYMDFPLPTWRVAGLIPEAGMAILAAEPKLGKTWLALQLSQAIAAGKEVLGRRVMARGKVLYLAYEDGMARARDRISAQGWDDDVMESVSFVDGAGIDLTNPRYRQLLADAVRREGYKMVVIDTLKAALRDGRVEENQAEFANTLYALREAVCGAGASLLIIHHHRKARAGDVSADMRGTSAIGGSADIMLGLYRRDGKVVLDIRGRDLPTGDQSIQVRFCKESCTWVLSEQKQAGEVHERILQALQKGPMTAGEVVSVVSYSKSVVYDALGEMQSWGWVRVEERRTNGRPARVYVSTLTGPHVPTAHEAPSVQLAIPPRQAQDAPLVQAAPSAHAAPKSEPPSDVGLEGWSVYQRLEGLIRGYFEAHNRRLEQVRREALKGIDPKGPHGRHWKQVLDVIQAQVSISQKLITLQAVLRVLPDAPEVERLRAKAEALYAESVRAARDFLALLSEKGHVFSELCLLSRVENAPGPLWYGTRDILDKLRQAGFEDLVTEWGDMIQPYNGYNAKVGIFLLARGVWVRRRDNPEGFERVWPRMTECLQMALGDKWANLLNCQDSYGQAG